MKTKLEFEDISRRLRQCDLPVADCVAGVLEGGLVPACLAAHQLGAPLRLVPVNYRDEENRPRPGAPRLTAPMRPLPDGCRRVLLVDDVSVSGKTLDFAKKQLADCEITTLVMKGLGDIVLFPEIEDCVLWPWKQG